MNLHKDKTFADIVSIAANGLEVEEAIVQKDYFVTLFLKELVKKDCNIVFKGGTSLSKCYRVIKRFSEDIDLNYDSPDGRVKEGMRKRLYQNIIDTINRLDMILIESDSKIERHGRFNRYVVDFPHIESSFIKNTIVVETMVNLQSFPTKIMTVECLIADYLKEIEREDLIIQYNLEPFEIKVQSLERTFIDKIFAVVDYYMNDRVAGHGRHIYDLYKIYPLITFDKEFRALVQEIRKLRQHSSACVSAPANVDVNQKLMEMYMDGIYSDDYELTRKMLFEDLNYEKAVGVIPLVVEQNLF